VEVKVVDGARVVDDAGVVYGKSGGADEGRAFEGVVESERELLNSKSE
jgi:hypothetical protein